VKLAPFHQLLMGGMASGSLASQLAGTIDTIVQRRFELMRNLEYSGCGPLEAELRFTVMVSWCRTSKLGVREGFAKIRGAAAPLGCLMTARQDRRNIVFRARLDRAHDLGDLVSLKW
jgi:hypothetical protein